MTANEIEQLAPLFDIPLVRYRIMFETRSGYYKKFGSKLRGNIGYFLKKHFCHYNNFSERPCTDCSNINQCGYVHLFSPVVKSVPRDNEAQSVTGGEPLRPFVLTVVPKNSEGNGQHVDVTLFGPAMINSNYFLDAVVYGLEEMQTDSITVVKRVLDVFPLIPEDHTEIDLFLKNWIIPPPHFLTSNNNQTQLRIKCLTPVILTIESPDFLEQLIRSALSRLRDLKRAFGTDNHMGNIPKKLHKPTVLHNDLYTCFGERYSFSQKRFYRQAGQCGQIVYSDLPLWEFFLLQACEIIHVGKGTSWGNGQIQVSAAGR